MQLITFALWISIAATQCAHRTVRKEIAHMTTSDWNLFSDTIQKANIRQPNANLSMWEEGAWIHNSVSDSIHWNCLFFFWHRRFTVYMERRLQQINPDFFFPYFDSARSYNDIDHSIVWEHIGSYGSPVRNDVLFHSKYFKITGMQLTRNLTHFPVVPSLEQYNQLYQDSLRNGGYTAWYKQAEIYHGMIHMHAGGQMISMFSPLDPLFYLHHSYMDLLWSASQQGWDDHGFGLKGQVGGLLNSGQSCDLKTTKLPYFNEPLESVLKLDDWCVEYQYGSSPPQPQHLVPPPTSASQTASPSSFNNWQSEQPSTAVGSTDGSGISLVKSWTASKVATSESQEIDNSLVQSKAINATHYPPGYVHMTECPPPVPQWWISRQEHNSFEKDMKKTASELDQSCGRLLARIQEGDIPAVPMFFQKKQAAANAKALKQASVPAVATDAITETASPHLPVSHAVQGGIGFAFLLTMIHI